MKTPVAIKNVLDSIFRRKGLETAQTKIFENFPEPVKSGIAELAKLRSDELPVLASVAAGDRWLLITTQRVCFYCAGKMDSCNVSELTGVAMALSIDASAGATKKNDLKHLRLIMESNPEFMIEVENGRPYVGIWNTLLYFVALNKKMLKGVGNVQ